MDGLKSLKHRCDADLRSVLCFLTLVFLW